MRFSRARNPQSPLRHGNVCQGHDLATKTKGFVPELSGNRLWTATGTALAYFAATTQPNRQDVWHSEIGPRAAHINHEVRLPWESIFQYANVRRRTADVDNQGI
jgi:hypothetical protein